jgi:hypothetical protein
LITMWTLRLARPCAAALIVSIAFVSADAQELPRSGVTGFDAFYATSPDGTTSQLLSVNVHRSLAPIALAPPVGVVPSRWAHRRRTLGALETKIALADRGLFLTPMGDAVGNGSIHMVDLRGGGAAQTDLELDQADAWAREAETLFAGLGEHYVEHQAKIARWLSER